MNRRLIKRLDLLAEIAETQLRADIARLTASLADINAQRATLASYQSRLTASWTNGATTQTATAQRAEIFCAAARQADSQIIAREIQLQSRCANAMEKFSELKTRRKKLQNFAT